MKLSATKCASNVGTATYFSSASRIFHAMSVALISGILPYSLFAQQELTDDELAYELPIFVVTATKEARPILEVPMSIQAVDSQKLSDFGLFSLQDVQILTPGLYVNMNDPRNPVPSMRGVTFEPDSGTTAAVDVYWNETAIDGSTAFRSMYDVAQIEVLKGPQGTLRGRSSPGGAITIATRRPDLELFGAHFSVSASDQNLFNTQFAINAPIVKGKLAVRVAGLYDGNDAGGVKNVVRNHEAGSITRSWRATLDWKVNDDLSFSLVHQYLRQVQDPYNPIEGSSVYHSDLPQNVDLFDRISVNPGLTHYEDEPVLTSLTAEWNLPGDHQLVAVLGRQKRDTLTVNEFDNALSIIRDWTHPQILSIESETNTYEIRFSSINHDKWNYILGAYYEEGENVSNVQQPAVKLWFDGANPYVSTSPVPRAPDMVIPLDMDITGDGSYKGIFTTQTFQIDDKWKLEGGLRYQQIKSNSLQSAPDLGINAPTERDEDPVTGSLSLSYQQSDALLYYFSVGRSYRPGGEGFRNNAEMLEKYLHYDSETSMGYELGIKSTWYDNRLQLNGALFRQEFDGFISHSGFVFADTNFDGISDNNFGITFNGDARTQGLELGMALSLKHRVVINLDATFIDAVWTDANSPTSVSDENGTPVFNTSGEQVSYRQLNGERMGSAPRVHVSGSIDWSKDLGSYQFFTRGLFRYQGNRINNRLPEEYSKISGYGVVDLFAGLRSTDSRWSFTLWVKNVLDKEILVDYDTYKNIGLWPSGYREARIGPQREVGISATLSF